MAITLASDALSDAEITDGIGLGDLEAAARLWVRHWPTALTAAREFVGPDEVPGLAAEALIATVSAIAIGRGPRENVSAFVTEAVRELGEDDEPAPSGTDQHPPVFLSPMMTTAFAELDPELQESLRAAVAEDRLDDEGLRALTVLQHYYLAEHTDKAETKACRRAHIAMMSVADSSATEGVPGATWLHMSTCAWCTEAFHEVSFSNVALGALIDASVLAAPALAEEAPAVEETPAAAITYLDPWEREVGAVEDPSITEVAVGSEPFETVAAQPPQEPRGFVEPVFVPPDEPFFDGALVPAEEDDDEAAVVGAAHVGSRRGRLIAVGIAAAAAVSVIAVVLVGNNDTTAPTAAGTDTTQGTPTDGATVSDDTGSPSPSEFATVAGPRLTATASATKAANPPGTAVAKPTTAAPKPTATATSAPSPTSAPTTAQPTPTPTPTPTATPTKRCNALQHLFGLC